MVSQIYQKEHPINLHTNGAETIAEAKDIDMSKGHHHGTTMAPVLETQLLGWTSSAEESFSWRPYQNLLNS